MKRTVQVLYDEQSDEYYIELHEIADELGWKSGDIIEWVDNKNGTFTLTKKED